MQVMVEASDIGLKKIIRSYTEAMEMVPAMRVSAAGWLYDSIERTREVARATGKAKRAVVFLLFRE